MSPRLRIVFEVANWEFWRYYKLKQQIIGLIIMIVAGGVTFGIVRLNQRSGDDVTEVAVLAEAGAALPAVPASIRLTPRDAAAEGALRREVGAGDLDGLLRLAADGSGVLLVRRESDWVEELRGALTLARRGSVMERENISPDLLADVLAPAELRVDIHENAGARGSRFAFMVVIWIMLLTVFTGMGYIFASITGEKQIRVTEQVMSAIPARSWIDGKILGIAAASLAGVMSLSVGFVVLFFILRLAGIRIAIPASAGDPVMLAVIASFALLGLFLWLSFLAAVAAMIDDPHTSTRGGLLMVPLLASSLAFLVPSNPDGGLVRVLALLPPTAPTAMPARMLLTDVPPLEILLSVALLIGGVLLLRIAAARVFRIGMLMYGKEPTWAEVRRWVMSA